MNRDVIVYYLAKQSSMVYRWRFCTDASPPLDPHGLHASRRPLRCNRYHCRQFNDSPRQKQSARWRTGFMTPIVLLETKTIARQITSISRQKLAVLRIVCSIFGMLAVLRPAANARSVTAISSGGNDDRLWVWGAPALDRRVVSVCGAPALLKKSRPQSSAENHKLSNSAIAHIRYYSWASNMGEYTPICSPPICRWVVYQMQKMPELPQKLLDGFH